MMYSKIFEKRFEMWRQAFAAEPSAERKAARVYIAVEAAYRLLTLGLIALWIFL